ncbi:undecaprenyldiphospho-muramoylpentapeptide beta-N-acetylglucosaminyltransferase [Zhengella sp. ZM62]|uniref:undecaprenyldiphospho-muramoylpentapeptide beta-N-acetylglucosaminyltransferase n=1 Tax=Zhengella sedimenti TaxID=3390035 RepID=UPI003974AB7A
MADKGVIVLAAGGTGGHLFPAEALAHELKGRGWSVHLATDERANRYSAAFPADEVHIMPSATLGSRNPIAMIKTLLTLWRGVREAQRVFARIKPSAVVGFGGYPTLPPLFAATRLGLPTMIHEQNAVMGRANKALAGRVTVIAGGFLGPDATSGRARVQVTGNPVRPDVLAAMEIPYLPPESGPINLLVFGGSQGAKFFSDVVPQAVSLLPEALRRRLVVTQQARPEDEARVKTAYADLGIEAEISPFFKAMAERMARAHLVICRSGASTVSEIAAIGRPALLVPYPHALDHDQAANAAALKAQGGAEVRAQDELAPVAMAGLLEDLLSRPERLSTMAAAAKRTGKPEAAQLLADLAEAIASGTRI